MKEFEIHRHLSAQYGDKVLPQLSAYEWFEAFENGWLIVTDSEH
jgi:hypothetical protein